MNTSMSTQISTILQTTFSYALCWTKIVMSWFQFRVACVLWPGTSMCGKHYLNQQLLRSPTQVCVSRLQWININMSVNSNAEYSNTQSDCGLFSICFITYYFMLYCAQIYIFDNLTNMYSCTIERTKALRRKYIIVDIDYDGEAMCKLKWHGLTCSVLVADERVILLNCWNKSPLSG